MTTPAKPPHDPDQLLDQIASTNVGRTYALAGVSITVFTFTLTFLFPGVSTGKIDPLPFQVALALMGVGTFAFVFGGMAYYGASLQGRLEVAERVRLLAFGDRFWLVGYTLLFLNPSLILAAVGLLAVAAVWFGLWLIYIVFITWYFPRTSIRRKRKDATPANDNP